MNFLNNTDDSSADPSPGLDKDTHTGKIQISCTIDTTTGHTVLSRKATQSVNILRNYGTSI
jgi:hypothetical protein